MRSFDLTPTMIRTFRGTALAAAGLLFALPAAAQPDAPIALSGADDGLLLTIRDDVEEAPAMIPDASSSLFTPDARRLNRVNPRNAFGATPRASQETLDRYQQIIQDTIDVEATLDMVIGRPRILVFRQTPVRVQIPDQEIAEYTVISPRELSVTGMETGTTTLNIWFEDPDSDTGYEVLSYLLRVIPDPETRMRQERVYEALESEINAAFPNSLIELKLVGNKLLVQGQAASIIEASQIIRILEAEAPGDPEAIPMDVDSAAFGEGEAATLPPVRSYMLGSHPNIINMLRVPNEQQIQLSVTVAEVNRSAARSIGFNFSYTDDAPGIFTFSNDTGSLMDANLPFSYFSDYSFQAALKALRNNNLARTLAEPNLVTINGRSASFRTGGSFPVPVVTGATETGLQGVEFEEFGVRLEFTPYVIEDEKIRLVIDAEVTARDEGSGGVVGATSVPGLDERTFNTTVELADGETLAVAGILQTRYVFGSEKIPFFGDLPVLGPFLGSLNTTSTEQELVIVVKPEIVTPLLAEELPALPGHDLYEPDDFEFYLLGRAESRAPLDFRSAAQSDFDRLRHHRMNQVYISGPVGHALEEMNEY